MGASHTWRFRTSRDHTLVALHALHSGRVKLVLDGEEFFNQAHGDPLWDLAFEHDFVVDGVPCRLELSICPHCCLVVDGVSQTESPPAFET